MQQQSVIHDPRTFTTPSERLFAARRRDARQRMSRAAELFNAFSAPLPAAVTPPLPPIPNSAIERASELVSGPVMVMGEIERIQRAVLTKFPDVTMNDLKSPRRFKMITRARQIAMYLAKDMTTRSYPDIGRRFGGRDHSTGIHAFRKIQGLLKTDTELAALVAEIKFELGEAAQ